MSFDFLSQKKGYFKNFEFNQLNVQLFERQAESDRARLERGEISLTDFAQSEIYVNDGNKVSGMANGKFWNPYRNEEQLGLLIFENILKFRRAAKRP